MLSFQQVFRSAIDSSFLQQLQDWLTCSLPTFLSLPEQKAVWSLSVVFLSASINLHLMKLFPLLLSGVKARTITAAATTTTGASTATTSPATTPTSTTTTTTTTTTTAATITKRMSSTKLGHHEIALFVTSAQDFYAKLGTEQKLRFRDAFKEFHHIKVYNKMLQSLWTNTFIHTHTHTHTNSEYQKRTFLNIHTHRTKELLQIQDEGYDEKSP